MIQIPNRIHRKLDLRFCDQRIPTHVSYDKLRALRIFHDRHLSTNDLLRNRTQYSEQNEILLYLLKKSPLVYEGVRSLVDSLMGGILSKNPYIVEKVYKHVSVESSNQLVLVFTFSFCFTFLSVVPSAINKTVRAGSFFFPFHFHRGLLQRVDRATYFHVFRSSGWDYFIRYGGPK